MAYKTNLGGSTGTFAGMMNEGFGIVTVMNAYVCDALNIETLKGLTAYQIANAEYNVGSVVPNGGAKDINAKVLCRLDTLKIANVTQEGPTKTISGGQYSNPLIKFGKSARLEMQDALGNAAAIEALCGGIQEWKGSIDPDNLVGLHFGEDFVGPKMIVGDSFFIDRKSGQQVPVKIVFYQFLPDSIFNLTQDAEGDATVFDMNGDLLTTDIKVAREDGSVDDVNNAYTHGVFYSIINPNEASIASTYSVNSSTLAVTGTQTDDQAYYSANGGLDWTTSAPTVTDGDTVLINIENAGRIVWSKSVTKTSSN